MRSMVGMVLGLFLAGSAQAASYAVQDAGSAHCATGNVVPATIVGNYTEDGVQSGKPYYNKGNGWYIYATSIFGADSWVVSTSLGSSNLNNGTIAFYTSSSAATPPASGYSPTNSGCGAISVQAGVTVPPPAAPVIGPLNSGVLPYISSGGSTTVYWQGVSGVVGYKLDVATDLAFTSFVPGYEGKVVTGMPTPPTFATVTGLSNAGTTYYFRVRSYNGGGDSAPSATVSSTTIPAVPVLQAASDVRAQRFTAHWSASAGASGHRLQVCTDVSLSTCLPAYNPAALDDTPSALVTGLSQNTTYYYRVAAGNENGYSAYSGSASLTTNSLPVLGGSFTTAGAVNDNATIAPFAGVTVSDANGQDVSVQITYTAANGTLTGTGLTGSAGNYLLAAAAPATATAQLQALVFHPTYGQGPTGSTVSTVFTLQPNDGIDNGASNSATQVTTTMTNVAPVFVGATNSLTVNADSGANDVKPLLHVSDPNVGQTETWSAQTLPTHGTLQITGATAAAGGSDIAPSGTITYAPNPGYSGSDSFAVQVHDGFNSAVRTISVTVQPVAPAPPGIGTATAGDGQASVTFTAPVSNGGSPIQTYTATSSPQGHTGTCAGPAACTITVGSLANGTTYTFTVTATNGVGTGGASTASNSVTPKGNQTITFNDPGPQTFGATPTLTASAPGGAVTFTSSTSPVCTITSGGTLTLVKAGSCTIHADQAGNGSWNAAPTVPRTFAVNAIAPGAPAIGTATAGNTQATVTFTAPASNGGAAIQTYTATSSPDGHTGTCAGPAACTITVGGLTNGTAYTFTVTATNAATLTGSASAPSNSITPKAPQTITFNAPGPQTFGTTPTLTASAPGGAVSFTSSTAPVCTISTGGTLAFVAAGDCTIHADQAGSGSYLAAPQVSQTFTVNAVAPGAPTIGTATAGNTQATVTFTEPASNGGTAIQTYTATSSPDGHTGTCAGPAACPITVGGLTNGTAYTFTVTATNAATLTGPASAASNSITPKAPQTITFSDPGPQTFGTTPTLTASAPGGAVTFTASTAPVCTITTGGTLAFVAAGDCTIHADQAGSGSYLAAPQVSHTFPVNAIAPGAPAIGTATAGNTQAAVHFTAPASTGGAAITGYIVTVSPGNATVTGTASPIAVTGLANGTPYTFTVQAVNSAGPGAASAASNSVVPQAATTGTVPVGQTGSGTATATTQPADPQADPTCNLASAEFTGDVPPGYQYTYGTFEFLAAGCTQGVTITLTYPQPLALGVKFMKYGPKTPLATTSEWFEWTENGGVQVSADRKTITYTVLDNGVGDTDPRVGYVNDPMAPAAAAAPVPATAAGIPTLGEWALALLSLLLGLLGWRRMQAIR